MHCERLVLACILAASPRAQTYAQTTVSEGPLPVAGTLIYNLLFLSRPFGSHRDSFGARFGGRFAVRIAPRTYVGFAVGSWAQAQTGQCAAPVMCGTFADYWSEAIVHQVYAQHSPFPQFPGWLRLGVGLAKTSTLIPSGGVIGLSKQWRAAVSGGVGVDVRVGSHLFLTPSIDYTQLRGVLSGDDELRHALAIGFGVTFR
jgi:hypothetical protein